MRVCPKCGYADNPLWENCRFKRDLQLMRIEDFKKEYPHLEQRIERERYIQEGQFIYHKSSKYVLRKESTDSRRPFWEEYENRHRKQSDISDLANRKRSKVQRKLSEVLP